MKRTLLIIVALFSLTLPMASLASSSQKDDDKNRRTSRNWDDHDRFHRALAAEHRNFHQYNKIDDWEDRIRHRRFHRYLEAKHRRAHAHFCDECWRWFYRLRHHDYNDEDKDWNERRGNSRHDHH